MTDRLVPWLRLRWAIFAACLLLIQAGCWHSPGDPNHPRGQGPTGGITVAAHVPSTPGTADPLPAPTVLEIILEQGPLLLERTLPVEDGMAVGTLDGIYEGRWKASFHVRDDTGVVTHRDETELTVVAHQSPLLVEVTLEPLPGHLRVQADLANFTSAAQVGRARLVQRPGEERHDSVRAEGEDTIVWDVPLSPGTYDLQVQLYGETFHSHRLIYASSWISIDMLPGREALLNWQPATEEVEFIGVVHTLPAPPREVTPRVNGPEIIIQWENVSTDAPEAVIFWKVHPLEPFEELTTVPVHPLPFPGETTTSTYRHDPRADGVLPPASITYAVAAVDSAGRRSLRASSRPIQWHPDR